MLAQLVPAPLVRLFASPYVAGENIETALDVAAQGLVDRELLSTLDLLGESVTEPAQVEANVAVYEKLIRAVSEDTRFEDRARRPTISLKPSAFTVDEPEASFEPIARLVDVAHEAKVGLTIDMEDHRWTDATLAHSIALFEKGFDVGTVVQSRLFRTKDDLEKIPAGMRIRVVIGIYPEPEDIATNNKREMKEAMLELSERLIERSSFVEFATHDVEFVERFARDVAPREPEKVEVQMLLGVPRVSLQEQLVRGDFGCKIPVRLYIPFAIGWNDATAYLRRRMDESPSMMWLVLRNLFNNDR